MVTKTKLVKCKLCLEFKLPAHVDKRKFCSNCIEQMRKISGTSRRHNYEVLFSGTTTTYVSPEMREYVDYLEELRERRRRK